MIVLLIFVAFNPFVMLQDSVDITICNGIELQSIHSINYLVNQSWVMESIDLEQSIPPGESVTFRMPARFLDRMIFETDSGSNFRMISFMPGLSSDTLLVTRAHKEFGGFFDVIMGTRPYAIRNATTVPITNIILRGEGFPDTGIMNSNPLLTDEILFLWSDQDSITITALDIHGNLSDSIHIVRQGPDSIFSIQSESFLGDIPQMARGSIRIVNGINGTEIKEIEIYTVLGDPIFLDLSASPLDLWQSVTVPNAGNVEFIVCIDTCDRTYSAYQFSSEAESYIVDWWSLDLNFNFPEGSH
ncbi:MAG: hypothetical protein KAS73_08350 [Candidatus Sabulitectum sp.]|nr:hypothetical protein [Candidatus Sabulitectum sp.]